MDRLYDAKSGKRIAPIYVRIKPTNKCNHDCYYCHYKSPYLELDQYKPDDEIPREKMIETIGEFGKIGVKAVTFSGGGEPLLYPYIEETMEHVLGENIDLSIITNGSLLAGRKAELLANAKWVRISEESGCAETYSKIRGVGKGAFDVMCDNIANFASIKNANCELGVNYVIGPQNYNEVFKAGKLMQDLGVNHIKYTALISNDVEKEHEPFKKLVIEQINDLIKSKNDDFRVINLYEKDFESCAVFGRQYDFCGIKDFVTVLAANSKVYYCHDKAYLSDGEVGDISGKTFSDMWFSDETTEKFKAFNPKELCKHHCVYDDRNNLLNDFYNLSEQHVNFI